MLGAYHVKYSCDIINEIRPAQGAGHIIYIIIW